MNRFLRAGLSVLCSLALACALVPAAVVQALANTNIGGLRTFELDGIIYGISSDNDTWGHFVQVSGYDASSIGSVVEIPSTVKSDDGTVYSVTGIDKDAFNGCDTLQDIRIGDLTYYDASTKKNAVGLIASSAFDNCSNLAVIHFYGQVGFSAQTHLDNTMQGVGALKIIVHGGAWDALSAFEDIADSSNRDSTGFPGGTESYYAVTFKQGSSSVELYVKGPSLTSEYEEIDGTKVSSLASLTSADVYCDASLGSQAACPNNVSSVPALSGGNDAWGFSSESGTRFGSDDSITCIGTATGVSSTNLNYGQLVLDSSELTYRGVAVEPACTAYDAKGTKLDASQYMLSYTNEKGAAITEVVDEGTYTVTATPTEASGYTGSCSATFTVSFESATWSRYCGNGSYAVANAAVAGMNSFADTAGVDAADMSLALLVNPGDYASCALAASLSALGGYPIYATGKKSLPADTRAKLSFVSKVVVLGSSKYISDSVYNAVLDISSVEAAMQVASDASDAASAACAVAMFVQECTAGEYGSLKFAESYGDTALVLPTTGDAAVFSALAWGVSANAPVFFAKSDGTLSAATTTALGSYAKVVAAGFSSSASSALSSQLSSAQVTAWNAKASATASSLAYMEAGITAGNTASYLGVAGASNYAAAAAGAAAAGHVNGVLAIVESDNAGRELATWLAPYKRAVVSGAVFGGYADVSMMSMESLEQATQLDDGYNLAFASIRINKSSFTCTGKAVAPRITLTLTSSGTTTTLAQGTDCNLTFYNNATNVSVRASNLKEAGSYTAVLTGSKNTHIDGYGASTTGVYTGTRSIEFTIGLSKPALTVKAGKKSFTAKAKKVAGAAGFELAYKKGSGSYKTMKVKTSGALSKQVKKLAKGKKYTVRVRAYATSGEQTIYSAWSKMKTVRVK